MVEPLLDTVRKLLLCVIREMRIHFGMVLTVLRRRRINENMVWTDSLDYGATMYLSTENVKKSLLWLSPPVLKWFLTETDLSTLLRG